MAIDIVPLVEAATGFDPQKNGGGTPLQAFLVTATDSLPPWWTPARDAKLRAMVRPNNYLAGVLYHALSKLNIPIVFTPRNPRIQAQVDRLAEWREAVYLNSQFGRGLDEAFKLWAKDWLTQDNGAFMEIIGPGDPLGPISGLPLGVRHLDASRCRRVYDPVYPVVYRGDDSKFYRLHHSRLITSAQMAETHSTYPGVGLCAVSRSHMVSQSLVDAIVYKMEKMGSRPTSQILYTDGDATDLVRALVVANELMDSLGLTRHAQVAAVGNITNLGKLDLNQFDPFNERDTFEIGAYALAMTWGLDARDIWPLVGNKSNEEIANMRAAGKLPADYVTALLPQLQANLTPGFALVAMDYQDDSQDQSAAIIGDIRSRDLARRVESGALTPAAARRLMYERGDIDEDVYFELELAEGRLISGEPIAGLFTSIEPLHRSALALPGVANPLAFSQNDPDQVIRLIEDQRLFALDLLQGTTGKTRRRLVREALGALDWLEDKYRGAVMFNLAQANRSSLTQAGEEEEEELDNQEQSSRRREDEFDEADESTDAEPDAGE